MKETERVILSINSGTVAKRKSNYLGYLIAGISGLWVIFMSRFLINGSLFELGGGIILICLVTNIFKKN